MNQFVGCVCRYILTLLVLSNLYEYNLYVQLYKYKMIYCTLNLYHGYFRARAGFNNALKRVHVSRSILPVNKNLKFSNRYSKISNIQYIYIQYSQIKIRQRQNKQTIKLKDKTEIKMLMKNSIVDLCPWQF